MTLRNEYQIEPSGESVGMAVAAVAERAEAVVGSVDQTVGSAAQAIQEVMHRTRKSASAAMGTVADGIDTSREYLTNRGMGSVVEDVEALIRRYPYQALVIGSSIGFLLSRSWKR